MSKEIGYRRVSLGNVSFRRTLMYDGLAGISNTFD